MTTNIDRAAEVIEDLIDEPHMYPDGGLPDAAAQALADAGLLMPDLPEPVWRPHAAHEYRYHAWPVPVIGQVERNPRPGALIAITDGDEDIITLTAEQAKAVAYALLAAAAMEEA